MFFSKTTLFATFATLSTLLITTALPLHKRSYSGRATYYAVGLGACGSYNVASDYIVALNSAQYGSSYPGPECGKQIWISYGGKTASATIMDECPGCGYGDLDFSQGLFEHFASTDVGQFQMTWDYADSTPTTSTTSTTTWQAPTSTSTSTSTTPTSTYTPPTTTSQAPATSSTVPSTSNSATAAIPTTTTNTTNPSSPSVITSTPSMTTSTQSTPSQSFFISSSPSAKPSSVSSSNTGKTPTLSNIETLSKILANLGQLVVIGSS